MATDVPLFLGVEGGGTHTVAIAADLEGRLIHRVETGPANLKLMTDSQLVRQFAYIARQFSRPGAIGIALAGLRRDEDRVRVLNVVAEVWPGVPCQAAADLDSAMAAAELSGANPKEPRVLVLSGTGSCCYGRAPGGAPVKVGGWGHLLGDNGSAYQIALSALKAVISQNDRDGVWPPLGKRTLRALHLNHPDDLIAWAQAAEKKDIAALTPEVFEAWVAKDRIAATVLDQASNSLAIDAAACAARIVPPGTKVRFIFAGSVLLRQPRFARLVSEQIMPLWPQATFMTLERESAWGAVRMAQEQWNRAGQDQRLAPIPTPAKSGTRDTKSMVGTISVDDVQIPEATKLSPTEQRNPRSMDLHQLPIGEAIALMLSEEKKVPGKLLGERRTIEACIRLILHAFRNGGRLFYVGAGTSGRLGTLDASECPPTFRTSPDQVQGIMAGGQEALWRSIEGAEDDALAGVDAARFRGVQRGDVVVGIAASGRTPFVWGALHQARLAGAKTILLCFNPHLKIARKAKPDLVLAVNLGPEVLTGSTRLKAGTATKLLLNLFTTLSMVRLGKVVSNLMVDLNPSNKKLRERAIRIVRQLTDADAAAAGQALEKAGWKIKAALKDLAGA